MSQKIYTNLDIKGNTTIGDIANATSDTDKFLVSDAGVVKFRTGSEMLSDLGVAPGVASNIQHQVKAGVAINKGQAVYVTSADGTNMIVGLASNNAESTSSKTMGLLNATVAINGFANVIAEGLLAGLDTSTATVGDPVWLGINGNLIYGLANKPYAPAHLVFIGIVTRVNANNGEIFVKVQNGFELDEIHNVDLKTTTPVNGHILGHNGILWVNKTIAEWLGYTPANASGTTNYLSKFTGSTTLGNSQVFDNGTNVLIGTATDDNYAKLKISGGGIIIDNNQQFNTYNASGLPLAIFKVNTSNQLVFNPLWGQGLNGYSFTINGSEKLSISSGGTVTASSDMRAPVFYDSGNTAYYVDPASSSNLNIVRAANSLTGAWIGVDNVSITSGNGISLYNGAATGQPTYGLMFAGTATYGTHGSVTSDWATYFTMNSGATTRGWIFRTGTTNVASVSGSGILTVAGDMRSPIYYDSNNTAYYLDPASTSNLNGLTVASTISGNISGNAATATSSPLVSALGNYVWSASTVPTGYSLGIQSSFVQATNGWQSYGSVMNMNTYSGGGGALQLYVPYSPTYGGSGLQVRFGNYDAGGAWTSWKTLLASDNYSSYAVPLSRTITINGTSYDLSSDRSWTVSAAETDTLATVTARGAITTSDIFTPNNGGIFFNGLNVYGSGIFGRNAGQDLGFNAGGTQKAYLNASGDFTANASLRSPIFYDSNNTGYYVDPASFSTMGRIHFRSSVGDSGAGGIVGRNHAYDTLELRGYGSEMMIGSQGADLHINYRTCNSGTANHTPSTWYWRAGSASSFSNHYWGLGEASLSLRAPIFYDSNDTGYYVDPNGDSRLYRTYIGNYTNHMTLGIWDGVNNRIEAIGQPLFLTSYGGSIKFGYQGSTQMELSTAGVLNVQQGYISTSNPWGTSNSAFFPNGITTAGNDNWIYGHTYIGNSPGNGAGHEFWSTGKEYHRSNEATNGHGASGRWLSIQSANGNFIPYSFESEYGNHSWGTVARFRINQSGADRPSIQFSSASSDTRWNIGYCYADDNFRIVQNMGYRNDNSTSDGWGTERLILDTAGNFYSNGLFQSNASLRAPIFYDSNDTAYFLDLNNTGKSGKYAGYLETYASANKAILVGNWNGANYWGMGSNGAHTIRFDMVNADSSTFQGASDVNLQLGTNTVWHTGNDGSGSGLDADLLDGLHANDLKRYDESYDFYVDGDANTYYPVTISASAAFSFSEYSISRGYAWAAPNTWNNSTHRGGLTFNWKMTADSAWGGNDHSLRVIEFYETYSTMVAGLALSTGNGGAGYIVVWLRGGGALYRVHGPLGVNGSATVHLSGFTGSNGTVYPTRSNTNSNAGEILSRYPVRGSGDVYSSNNLVLHAGNYNSYSPTLTGGNASGTWGINISGNADTVDNYHVSSSASPYTIPLRNGSGYLAPGSWIQLDGDYGLYSPNNGAHFYPNNGSYGPWKVQGSRNGWGGLEFAYGSAGNISLMISGDSQTVGFHNNSSGWQVRWNSGRLWSGRNATGGNETMVLQEDSWTNQKYFGSGGEIYATQIIDSVNTAFYFDGNNTGDSIRVAGDIVAYYSDERLKDRKGNIENALEKVLSLNGFYYTPNAKAQELGYEYKEEVGVSAQEVEAILPELIKDAPIGQGYKTLNYGKLTPLLIEAIKEQQTQIDELKQLVNNLINK